VLGKPPGVGASDLLSLVYQPAQLFQFVAPKPALVVPIHQLVQAPLLGIREGAECYRVRLGENDQVTQADPEDPADRANDAQVNPLQRAVWVSKPVERLDVEGTLLGGDATLKLRPSEGALLKERLEPRVRFHE
jgi:hypothetical protein